MGIDYISIGNRIKEIRAAKGWTQAKLAEESQQFEALSLGAE